MVSRGERDGRVAVVGLGAIGSLALWRLSLLGVPAVGFERNNPRSDGAAFGGATRMARPGHQTPGAERLLSRGVALWERLSRDSREDLVHECGTLTAGPLRTEEVAGTLRRLCHNGTAHEALTVTAAAERFPQHAFTPDDTIVWSPRGLVLRSNAGVTAAVDRARRMGAEVRYGCPVLRISTAGHGLEVTSGSSAETFSCVIVTAGPWMADLLEQFTNVVVPRSVVSTWFDPRDDGDVGPHRFPVGSRRFAGGSGFSFFPGLDGGPAKVNLWLPDRPRIEPGWGSLPVDRATVGRTTELVRSALPGLDPRPVLAQAYPEGFTADRHPIIREIRPGLIVATGFSGSGFGVAPAVGDQCANQALARVRSHERKT